MQEVKDTNIHAGRKNDSGKARWDLLPPSLDKVVEVFTIGAKKYADRNWEKGILWSRIFAAMMRHAWKWWWHGEKLDPVDGQHHLASVAWCALVLMHYEDFNPEFDDRPTVRIEPTQEGRKHQGARFDFEPVLLDPEAKVFLKDMPRLAATECVKQFDREMLQATGAKRVDLMNKIVLESEAPCPFGIEDCICSNDPKLAHHGRK